MESAAGLLVNLFRSTFINPETGQPECPLVRCFKTHRLQQLPTELQQAARNLTSVADTPCLTLLATTGDEPDWNDRTASRGHAVIPLESVGVVERAPMIAQLIQQMGLDIGAVLAPTQQLLLEADQRAYGVFHVEHALSSSFIPAQSFVTENGIQSVLGFGGLLPSGDFFCMILFSRTRVPRETAGLFRTLALSVKLVLLPFTYGPVFAGASTPDRAGPQTPEEELARSEAATLHLLLPALEDAAIAQTNRLEGAVLDLQLRADEVHQLGARLESVLESTSDAVFMLDRDWNFTYLNRHADALLRTGSSLLGSNIWELFPAAIGSAFWTSYHQASSQDIPVHFEEYYPAPLDLWFEVHAFPNPDGLAVFFHDITARRLATDALIKSEKLAAVGRLAASIAHEINNPLESVTNLLYLAQASDDLAAIRDFLHTADRELRRIGAITTQTLRFHRQSSSPTAVSCEELVEGVLSIYQGRIVNSSIHVELRFRRACRLVCFEGEIRQVLNNLAGNAIDAMQGGGRLLLRGREATDWRTGRTGVVLTIADTGPGISPAAKSKLFEPFFSTKGMGGTGLGLWISESIVAGRHQGVIRVRSSQSPAHSGTIFTVFLPAELRTADA